ncbi:hypothetical protein ACF0H5_024578 [Mactra antiquata]
MPFIDAVHTFSSKIISWDGQPKLLPTSDDKRILVDTTARWRISNAAKFYATLSSPRQAYAKLDNIIDSRVRTVVGRYPMDEVVRSDNGILADESLNLEAKDFEEGIDGLENYFTINEINAGRTLLADSILAFSREEINTDSLGIELVDMVIRQVRYPENVAEKAYERMASERRKRAALQRSTGEGARAKWQGRLERERETILAEAEATAASIYRRAYSKDPEFYRFWRTLDSYQQALPAVAKVFSTDMEYFDYLYRPRGNTDEDAN